VFGHIILLYKFEALSLCTAKVWVLSRSCKHDKSASWQHYYIATISDRRWLLQVWWWWYYIL